MTNNTTNATVSDDILDLDETMFLLEGDGGLLDDSLGSFINDLGKDAPVETDKNDASTFNTKSSPTDDTGKSQILPAYEPEMMNVVHMEVQENAKIPTFLQPVDRSNSGPANFSRFKLKKTKSKSSKSNPKKRKKKQVQTTEEENDLPDFLEGIDFDKDCGSSSSGSFNLSEMFLGFDDRSGAADAYKSAGANVYYNPLPSAGDSTNTNSGYNSVPKKIKISSLTDSLQNENQTKKDTVPNAPGNRAQEQSWTSTHGYNYYPYGRHEMLPITSPPAAAAFPSKKPDSTLSSNVINPIKNVSATGIKTSTIPEQIRSKVSKGIPMRNLNEQKNLQKKQEMSSNVGTNVGKEKATLPFVNITPSSSSTYPTKTSFGSNMAGKLPLLAAIKTTGNKQQQNSPAKLKGPSTTAVSSTNKSSVPQSNAQLSYVYRSSVSHNPISSPFNTAPSQMMPAKSTPVNTTGKSILGTAKRQNQFGFGGNHRIPSIPQPPPSRLMPKLSTTNNVQNTLKHMGKNQKLPYRQKTKAKLGEYPVVQDLPVNKAAYERKKQRAKDSRVRLNEAIEKLSLSISVAGIQSEKRKTNNLGFKKSTIEAMEKCVKTTKEAKKMGQAKLC